MITFNSEIINLLFLPLLIFAAKIIEVTLATIGLIFISKGFKKLATLMSFIEIFIYLFAISRLFENFTNIYYYIAYAGGYALGTYFGIWIEEKISIGYTHIRIISKKNTESLIRKLKFEGYKTTHYNAESTTAMVGVVSAIIKRKETGKVTQIISDFDKKAFYSIEDIRYVSA